MLDHEDLKWIAGTSTELNSILQQIARYADLARRHKGEHHYIDLLIHLLIQRVELASKTAQALFDRVTSTILAKTTAKTAAPTAPLQATFTVVPPPVVHAFPGRAARAKLPFPITKSRSWPPKRIYAVRSPPARTGRGLHGRAFPRKSRLRIQKATTSIFSSSRTRRRSLHSLPRCWLMKGTR